MAKIETETMKINYKSDFDFKLNLKAQSVDGSYIDVGFPTYDFKGFLYTRGNRKYEFGKQGEVLTNCFDDNGTIHIVANAHSLFPGIVKIGFYADIPNDIYPDDHKLTFTDCPTNIELIEGCGGEFDNAQVELIAPYIKGDKGDKGDALTWDSMSQEAKKELVNSAVIEIKKDEITTLADTSDTTEYDEIF